MKIRSKLMEMEKKSYADDELPVTGDMMDCSLGCNPYGFPESIAHVMDSFDKTRLTNYPHSHNVTDGIIDYWKGITNLEEHNIILTDGSIAGIYLIVNVFAEKNAKVLGFAPQFSDFVANARLMGMEYTGIPLEKGDNYAICVDRMLEAMSANYSLIYIDNPNNPTGQLLEVAQLERILKRAEELDIQVIIDEAYGDFVSKRESALMVGEKYGNIITLRTFSKGFGMAGVRAGYIVTSKELNSYINKVSNPYMMGELSREIAAAALREDSFLLSHVKEFKDSKEALRNACGNNIFMAQTDDRVPICLLYHRDEMTDLQREFVKHGIVTVSGSDFEQLGKASVRLRVPKADAIDRLVRAVHAINEK